MPRASIADKRQSPPLTASAPSVEGTSVYRQYLPPRADSSDFGLLGANKVPQNGRFPAQDAMNHHTKFDAASFILAGEIRNSTNRKKQTN